MIGDPTDPPTPEPIELRDVLAARYDQLLRRLTRQLGMPELASDCLHDAWLRLGDISIQSALVQGPEAYVYRTACNLAIDRIRRERPWQSLEDVDPSSDQLVDPSAGPEEVTEARSELALMDRAMRSLPRRNRAVLVALRVDESTREEVAVRFNLSLRTVDTALRQSLEHCSRVTGRSGSGRTRATKSFARGPATRDPDW